MFCREFDVRMDNVGVHGDIQGDCEDLISKKQTVEVEEFTSRVLYMAMFGSRRSGRRVATPARRLNYSGFVIFTWISTAEISIAFQYTRYFDLIYYSCDSYCN
jgi:hypothetical protein